MYGMQECCNFGECSRTFLKETLGSYVVYNSIRHLERLSRKKSKNIHDKDVAAAPHGVSVCSTRQDI